MEEVPGQCSRPRTSSTSLARETQSIRHSRASLEVARSAGLIAGSTTYRACIRRSVRCGPSADAVAQAVAKQSASHLQLSGAAAANAFGLSTQVPAQAEYLTDGPSRRVHVGKLVVRLKHAGRVDMLLPDSRAGMAIVALRHLGRKAASTSVLQRLAATLDGADKKQLSRVRRRLPGWLGSAVDEVIGGAAALG